MSVTEKVDVINQTSVKFKRVVCPKELTDKTGCIRKDDDPEAKTSAATTASLLSSAVFAATAAWVVRLL